MLEGDSPPEYVAVVHEAAGCTSAGGASRGWRTRPRTRKTVLTRVFLAHQRRRSSGERATDVFPDLPGAPDGDAPLRLTLLDALARLPAKDRAVIVLRYWEERSVVISAFNTGAQHEDATRETPALTMEQLEEMALSPQWTRVR